MKTIELIDTTTSTIIGTVEFLKMPVDAIADFNCRDMDAKTKASFGLSQAKEISRLMLPVAGKHGGQVIGDVSGMTGIKWRDV
jgi:hypothetical protein